MAFIIPQALWQRMVAAVVTLLVTAGCTDNPGPARQSSLEDGATGRVPEGGESVRGGPGEAATTPNPARPFEWRTFDDAPSGPAVIPAAAETVERWIRDLGDEDDAVALHARHALLHQGFGVSAQLRVRAAGTDRGAVRAREMAEIFGVRLRWMWGGRGATGWAFTTDGSAVLSWTSDRTPGLTCRSLLDGRLSWSVTSEDIRTAFGIPYRSTQVDRIPQIAPVEPGKWRVMSRDLTVLDLAESTGEISVFKATRRGQIPDPRVNPPSLVTVDPIEIPGRGRARVSEGQLEICPEGEDDWYPVTRGREFLTTLAGSPDVLLAMTRDTLRTYSWSSLKLLFKTTIPLRTWWTDVCPTCGRIVLSGTEATGFAVISGARVPVFRVSGPAFSMTAMAVDGRRRWIATADSEGYVRVFLLGSLERLATARADGAVDSLRFSPDGQFLVATAITDAGDEFARKLNVFRLEPR